MEKHQELLIALRKVIRAIDLHSKHLSKTSGLTSPQLLIMLEIEKIAGVNSSQVAKSVNLSPATVTNILDRLANKGLVSRVRDTQDKRKVGLFLISAIVLVLIGNWLTFESFWLTFSIHSFLILIYLGIVHIVENPLKNYNR